MNLNENMIEKARKKKTNNDNNSVLVLAFKQNQEIIQKHLNQIGVARARTGDLQCVRLT